MESWKPATEAIRRELAAYRGNWAQQMTHRVPASLGFQTFIFLIWTGWRAGGLMLIGMALYKWKVLTGERSKQFYRRLTAAGFVVGLPVVSYGIIKNFDAGWSLDYSMFLGSQYNYWGSLFVSMGYIGMVILFSKANFFGNLRSAFAAVGRTALSNYLLQTLLCTTIFYGHGLGLFGKVDRAGQVLIVIAIWGFQLMISPLWLRHFQYGPAEWLWRSLTYKKIQPLRHRIQMA